MLNWSELFPTTHRSPTPQVPSYIFSGLEEVNTVTGLCEYVSLVTFGYETKLQVEFTSNYDEIKKKTGRTVMDILA